MALSEEAKAIQVIIGESLSGQFIETVLNRLESFGYEVTSADTFLIAFSIQKVEQKIKNECNVTEIPEGMSAMAVDMICGHVLNSKYSVGQLDLASIDLSGAIASVTEGSASVSFDNATSDAAKFQSLIQKMMDGGDFVCYRKIKW